MKLLCGLTEWKTEKASRGKAIGNDITSRIVLAMDNWNWVFGTQRGGKDDSTITGEKFFPSLRLLYAHLSKMEGFGLGFAHKAICKALNAKLSMGFSEPLPATLDEPTLMVTGKKMDQAFGTVIRVNDDVPLIKRLFGEADKDSE